MHEVCTGVCTVCAWACRSGPKSTVTLRFIDALQRDPFLRYLGAAPVDDEPVTVEEDATIAEVEADRRAGVPTVSFEEVRRRYS